MINVFYFRIEHTEVRYSGQAFRLGRYSIHFHLSGSMNGSYVRNCAIHHSNNRAITAHGVHDLLIEGNVAYDIKGHTYFVVIFSHNCILPHVVGTLICNSLSYYNRKMGLRPITVIFAILVFSPGALHLFSTLIKFQLHFGLLIPKIHSLVMLQLLQELMDFGKYIMH